MMVSYKHLRVISSLLTVEYYVLYLALLFSFISTLVVNGLSPNIPFFRSRPNNVSFNVGETATLFCSVSDLQTRFVVWRRMSEPNPLTIGEFVYSPDDRISILVVEEDNEWNLIIKDVNPDDTGVYECAVSSRKKYKRLVMLRIIGEGKSRKNILKDAVELKSQVIMSGKDFVSKGTTIFLMCNATGDDYAPDAVDWFINGHIVNHRTMSRVRIYNEVDSSKRTLHSTLEIRRSKMSDKGIYVCRGPDSKTDKITVHILDEEKSSHDKRGDGSLYYGSMNGSTTSGCSLQFTTLSPYFLTSLSAYWITHAYYDL